MPFFPLNTAPRPRRRWLLPLLLLTLLSGPLAAQHGRRYWEANPDSLRRVLDTERADTARLRTLLHLNDLGGYGFHSVADQEAGFRELVQLTRRLRRPEAAAFRLEYAASQLKQTSKEPAQSLDSLRAAVEAFDRLDRPIPITLSKVSRLLGKLKGPAAQLVYIQAKLVQYQARGAQVNIANCHFILGSPSVIQGDYNQGISHYLRSADLARAYNRYSQANQLKVVGYYYAEWGNPAKALHFLRQALAVEAALPRRAGYDLNAYTYWGMAQAYRQLRNYPAALRYATLALAGNPADTTRRYAAGVPANQAYGLVVKSAVLLDMGHGAEAGPLLARAQHLADSLKLTLKNIGRGGILELDATWARYYAARGEPARAEAAWLAAYRKAREGKSVPYRLAYLRALADFYAQQGQAAPAGRYARTALALSDSLGATQGAFHVAQYEGERAEQAQQARIQGLRLAQVQEAARARRQRLLLWAVLAVLALLAGLGFVLWRGNRQKQQANDALSRLNEAVTAQKGELQAQRDQLDTSLTELRATQAQLIQREKMASLGELTAGIAHEIQNPLNFVNNFAEVSTELLDELQDEQAKPTRDRELETELVGDLRQNLDKISHHGRRAASIVRGMLEHSRTSAGERAPADLNRLADEYLRLAYQGLRANDKSFNATLETVFAPGLPHVEIVGSDVGRVLLNLFSNAFYAVRQRQQAGAAGYAPTVGVSTRQVGQRVEIRVSDNGTGMPAEVQAKIFQPFFTTKPAGEGTGLGLSLSYDIITQGHGGTLSVSSQPGQGTEFLITLPA